MMRILKTICVISLVQDFAAESTQFRGEPMLMVLNLLYSKDVLSETGILEWNGGNFSQDAATGADIRAKVIDSQRTFLVKFLQRFHELHFDFCTRCALLTQILDCNLPQVKRFIEWLETAESESDDESEEDDSDS
jgi:hypothetical protein